MADRADAAQPKANRAKPKDRLAWLIKRHHIEPDHLELGEKILRLHEARKRVAMPHMHFDGGAAGGGSPIASVSAKQKWERLFSMIGAAGEAIVSCIIIDGMSLSEAAESLNLHPKAVLPMLRLSLDVLART